MRGREAYTVWAPENSVWSPWVRPVPFVEADQGAAYGLVQLESPHIYYADKVDPTLAVFVDRPAYHAVEEGLALAKLGWRPVPLYNCSDAQPGVMSAVENNDTEAALLLGAPELKSIPIPMDAPPAFLLDSNRLNRYKMDVSVFDNSWDLYLQDVPSAQFLLRHGIKSILLIADKIGYDLKSILYTYQKAGLKILHTNGFEPQKEILLSPPRKGKHKVKPLSARK